MRFRAIISAGAIALCLLGAAIGVRSENASGKASPTVVKARQVAERGLAFLQKDAAEWKTTRKCASCHQGTMTVWALAEAKNQGYPIPVTALADAVEWHKARLVGLEQPRAGAPGTTTLNSAALFTGLISATIPTQDAIPPTDVQRIVDHLRRYQEPNGAWLWSPTPAQNRPPPVFESDELATLLADVVLGAQNPTDAEQKSALREGRERAAAWLDQTTTTDTVQVQVYRLFRDVRAGKPRKEINARVARLLGEQNKDGGWSPEKGVRSDSYATGQVLYFLSFAGVKPEREEVRHAISFLALDQREDGSWFVSPRAHPGAKPFSNPSPISYYGSAWATMALMRMAPLATHAAR